MTHFFRRKFLSFFFATLLAIACVSSAANAANKNSKTASAKSKAKAAGSSKKGKSSKSVAAKKVEPKDAKAAAPAPIPAQPRGSASQPEAPWSGPSRSTDAAEGATYGDIHYKYKLNTALGVHILTGTGWLLGVGAQFGYAPMPGRPFYVGPELALALGSPGYLVDALMGAWYEVRVAGAPRLSLSAGLLLGATISSGIPGMNSLGGTALLDIALAQDINELVTIRGQIRPGVVGRYGAVLINFNVQFRFE